MEQSIFQVMRELEGQDERERAQGLSSAQRMRAIKPEAGQFLYTLLRAMNAQHIVEVGTSRGYSSLWLGAAALGTGGRVTTFEIDPSRAATARANHARAGLGQLVRVVEADAAKGLAEFAHSIDLLFIDAEKHDYIAQFDAAWSKVRTGGIIVADNVLSHAQELAGYLAHVRALPDAMSMTIPIGSGVEVTLKRKA